MGLGSVVAFLAGFGAQLWTKTNLAHFGRVTEHLYGQMVIFSRKHDAQLRTEARIHL